jgi:hypothetical protein
VVESSAGIRKEIRVGSGSYLRPGEHVKRAKAGGKPCARRGPAVPSQPPGWAAPSGKGVFGTDPPCGSQL